MASIVDSRIGTIPQGTDNESYLEDEKQPTPEGFNGATLELNTSTTSRNENIGLDDVVIKSDKQEHTSSVSTISDEMNADNFRRDRPGSTMSRTSQLSTASKTSMSTRIIQNDVTTNRFFCKKVSTVTYGVSRYAKC